VKQFGFHALTSISFHYPSNLLFGLHMPKHCISHKKLKQEGKQNKKKRRCCFYLNGSKLSLVLYWSFVDT